MNLSSILSRPSCALAVLVLSSILVGQSSGQTDPRRQAVEELDRARAARNECLHLRDHPDFEAAESRTGRTLDTGDRFLEAARSALASARQRRSPTAFQDAYVLARRASGEFQDYASAVEAELDAIARRRAAAAAARRAAEEKRAREEAERLARPPEALRQAVRAFLDGDYLRTIELATPDLQYSRARAHSALIRAAARYRLFLIGGETDYSLRGAAIEDILECRREQSALVPVETLFSPRFRDFFSATK